MHPVEGYLTQLQEIYRTGGGTDEESYYGALETLLNEVGRKLKPRVRCVLQLKNVGAGEPDFGLYTSRQFQRAKDDEPLDGVLPERGVIEVKGWGDRTCVTVREGQVAKYWARYGLVLVTNYWDFVLVGRDEHGGQVQIEAYRMADSEEAFRALLLHPRKSAAEQGNRLVEFLRRVMLHAAPITDPEDLAWFLASYAREARYRVETAAGLPGLDGLKKGLEEALGMKFEGERGEHFFQATLVQTLFYGVFSSWVLWCRENPAKTESRFSWHEAGWTLHVPMIRSLFDQIATPSRLKPLGVAEVLDWAGLVLNRVDRSSFFRKFEEESAVQYFYEPFLKAYDPELRKELGVWYTPSEIVQYQVERIDRVLREELELPDGLADEQVVVLDPCCGTGTYLLEVLKRIHQTLIQKGGSALVAQKLKRAAMDRVFGFEILPAPFVISHMQIGLMLRRLGAAVDPESDERAAIYLTNALTGWEPPSYPKDTLPLFPELMEERDAANRVKRDIPILVVLGNPPYNAYAGTSPDEEGGLVEPYKEGLTASEKKGGWGIRKFNLDDLYVRFFRLAERRIAEMTDRGVVSFISNFSYLGDPSFVVMRQRFLREFDKLWFDCMNGDSRETGKLTPEGKPDPSVFSTEYNREGIRIGTTICVMVRKVKRDKKSTVRFRHFWGVDKRQDLLDSLSVKPFDSTYAPAMPSKENRYSFRAEEVSTAYNAWPRLADLSACHYNGPVERRAGALISIERGPLQSRMKSYFDKNVTNDEVGAIYASLMMTGNRIVGPEARKKILSEHSFNADAIVKYPFKPFDIRWAYLANVRPLFSEPSPKLLEHAGISSNGFFVTRDTADKTHEGPPFYFSPLVCDYDCISGHARHFPILLTPKAKGKMANGQGSFLSAPSGATPKANLSPAARAYLAGVGVKDAGADAAGMIWLHALAVGYSPAYLSENADGIRRDWPRIPLPDTKKALLKSAELGQRVAALLDTQNPVDGVTCGKIQPELREIAVISRAGGGVLDPSAGALDMTAGWGHSGKGGVCMPGTGKCEKRKQEEQRLRKAFGDTTGDVYLNDTAYWANIPDAIWNFYIGGYQVIKKWLSYREKAILGRGLNVEEAEYVTEVARRIAAIILLQPDLDANYDRVKRNTWAWPSG